MTLVLPNPPTRPRHLDVTITSSLGVTSVRPVSARAKTWFLQNTNSEKGQLLFGDVKEKLASSFAALGFVIWWNPPVSPKTRELIKLVGERLNEWKQEKGWVSPLKKKGNYVN